MSFLNHLLTHFFVGICFGIAAVVGCYWLQRRRPNFCFRFGGNDPISPGDKSRWIGWYFFGIIFEIGSSWIMGQNMYVETALSPFEAATLTVGLFVVDRFAMIFIEPQSHWMPKVKKPDVLVLTTEALPSAEPKLALPSPTELAGIPDTVPSPEAVAVPAKAVKPETTPVREESWFRANLKSVTEKAGAAPKGFFRKFRAACAESKANLGGRLEARREHAEARRKAEEDAATRARDERLKKLKDGLKGY